jgi:hypothetical protein
VVPVGAGFFGHELVGEGLAGWHGVLGEAGDAVLSVRQVHAVPVQGGRLGQVIDEGDLYAVAQGGSQLGPGDGPVVRVEVLAVDGRDRRGQREAIDRFTAGGCDQVCD